MFLARLWGEGSKKCARIAVEVQELKAAKSDVHPDYLQLKLRTLEAAAVPIDKKRPFLCGGPNTREFKASSKQNIYT
eukprot:340213-Amphidinium_carterae.1